MSRAGTARARISTSGRSVDWAERLWQIFALAAVGILGKWYWDSNHYQAADRDYLFVSGVSGSVMAILAAALSIRKRLAYQGAGRMSVWLRGHIYLGLVSAAAIFLHSGFRAGGAVTEVLLAFFALTVVSGLFGLLIARKVPPLLTAVEEDPALIEDLIGVRSDCLRGLYELGESGSAEFRALVKGRLSAEASSLTRMTRFYRRRSTLAQEMPAFQAELAELMKSVRPHEHRAFVRAAEYALHANKMGAELLLQRTLRGWLTFHMAATAVMLAIAAVHIFSVLFY